MAVNRANFWEHYGKGKGHPQQLPRGHHKFQALLIHAFYISQMNDLSVYNLQGGGGVKGCTPCVKWWILSKNP